MSCRSYGSETRHISVELAVELAEVTVAELLPAGETMGREQCDSENPTAFNGKIAISLVKGRIAIVQSEPNEDRALDACTPGKRDDRCIRGYSDICRSRPDQAPARHAAGIRVRKAAG